MDPAPDAGQPRDDAVDTRLGTLGRQNLQHNLQQLQHAEASTVQSHSLSFPCMSSDVRSSFDSNSPHHDHLAADAAPANDTDPHPASYHDPSSDGVYHVSPPTIDPDDFYKNYRGPGASRGPDILPMAATSSSRPSLRSTGDGTTPRHPIVPAQHNLPRANLRSVSSPLDSRSSTGSITRMPGGKQSVKDLKKRFDQNATVGVPAIPPPPTRTTAGLKNTNNGASRSSSHRDTTSEDTLGGRSSTVGTSSLSLRQFKFVADNQVPGSTQSFASRVGKPRSSTDRELNSTKTAQKKSQTLPQPTNPASRHSQPPVLLFGEVSPDRPDASSLGHGIDEIRPRRTSESSLQIASSRQRNLYSPEIERSSLSSYHRSPPSHPEGAVTALVSRPRTRSRAHSDDGSSSPSSRAARHRASRPSPHSSKLPVSVRKFSTPSNSTSPSPTRSSSPSTLKRYQANGRPSRTSPGASRAKTPTQIRKSVTPSNSTARLQAFVAAPPPVLSPTLRSSRPRQPISIASTSSSRMKETDKAQTVKKGESTSRHRKISIGPIDFEQRREHIRLAYTKSIRENEALEAKHKADAENARHELENLPVPHDTSEAPVPSPINLSNEPQSNPFATQAPPKLTCTRDEAQQSVPDPDGVRIQQLAPQTAGPHSEAMTTPPLNIVPERQVTTAGQDSPTLGLPGGFPDQTPSKFGDKRPLSAVSATSDTTEFDSEPQINPPVQALSPIDIPVTIVKHATSQRQQRTEYQYPFEDEPGSPARASPKKNRRELAKPELGQAPTLPGSFVDDPEQSESKEHGIGSSHSQDMAKTGVSASESPVSSRQDDKDTIPFPRLDSRYDSDCQSEPGQVSLAGHQDHQEDDAATDTCTEATDDHEQEVGVQRRDSYDDASRSYRNSTCASSDAGVYDDPRLSGHEQQPQPQQQCDVPSTGNLLVPASRHHDERLSRQSAWTDFSVDSTDRSVMPSSRESPTFGHATIFSSQTESSINDGQLNRRELRESESSRPPSTHYKSLNLLEVDTGDGFSIACFSPEPNEPASYLPSPSHEPPPVPPSVQGSDINSRASSAYYEQSQYENTLLNSERGSDEYMSRADTSRSIDSASLATTEQYVSTQTPADSDSKSLAQDGEELTDKERHRLVQRRNVIKELVDTEAVFVRDMNIVEEIYKGTAEACPRLDSKTVKLIFRNSDEIIAFHTAFLSEIKEGVMDVYVPKGGRTAQRDDSSISTPNSGTTGGPNDAKDRSTCLGPVFKNNIEQMKLAHEGFLRASDQAAKRLILIQQDPTVQVWLNECNEVAKDLTAAWDLDSLLIKPMQRITKYPNLIITLLHHTPQDHPDREALMEAKDTLETAIIEINKTKKNFELVGQIVGRKRKESDVKAGFARAFGKRVDKLQASNNRPAEDADYAKLNEKFGDDYLRLQVVLRDVEFYTRQVSAYVHEFLQYMSSIELVMRLQPGNYPELESKWVQFNISVRDLEKVALEEHLSQVRKLVIEPFEQVIRAYGNPSLAMKKRNKRRLDFERFEQLRRGGKSPDPKLKELVEQYEALNDTLKKELPRLSALTERIGNICLGNFVNIQAKWYSIWKDRMKAMLADCSDMPDLQEVVNSFERDFPYANDQLANIGILNPATWGRSSLSMSTSMDDASLRTRARASDLEARSCGQSINGDVAPMLPTPDFGGRRSGSFTMSPSHSATSFANGNVPSPHQYYYRDYYAGIASSQGGGLASPRSPEFPSTGRSFESGIPRQSSDLTAQSHRDSNTTYNSNSVTHEMQRDNHRFSNMFRSAMPMPDGRDDSGSQRQSRASSRERSQVSDGYNVLWLAASLFEFNIATTKHEAGYPYLTYQAGEIFDVIAEKGELWLAKNQDDLTDQVGWIWSKHFAKLADS